MGIQQQMMDWDWNLWKSTEANYNKHSHVKSVKVYGNHLKTMAGRKPDVTIMILTHKRPETLESALKSALNQDYTGSYEIIISDDSGNESVDYLETDRLAREFCQKHTNIIYYRHEKNLGQYANWNRAVELCQSEWGGLLHDDDRLYPNYLSVMLATKQKYPRAGLIGSWFNSTDYPSSKIIQIMTNLFCKLRRGKPIALSVIDSKNFIFPLCPGMFVNRQRFLEIGGLDDISADIGFCSKMSYYQQSIFLPVVLSDNGTAGGESLSFSQEISNTFVISAYKLVYAICKEIGYSNEKSEKYASKAALYGEIAARGYNDTDYTEIKKTLGISGKYCHPLVYSIENLRSKLLWGLLLFR